MQRRALIIGNPGEQATVGYCKGVELDLKNYCSFLLNPIGGLWLENEIEVLMKPTRVQVEQALGRIQAVDYGFTVFAGHACERNGSTVLELRPGVEINADELRRGARRQTLILDCCRVIEKPVERLEAMIKAARTMPTIHDMDCRRYFDRQLEECGPGIVVMWACSRGEAAGDDESRGGYYSSSAIAVARTWAQDSNVDTSSKYLVLSVAEAHERTIDPVRRLSGGRQTPRLEKPRSDRFFPFSIVA